MVLAFIVSIQSWCARRMTAPARTTVLALTAAGALLVACTPPPSAPATSAPSDGAAEAPPSPEPSEAVATPTDVTAAPTAPGDDEQSRQATTAPTSAPAGVNEAATHVDADAGYVLRYPASWFAQTGGDVLILTTFDTQAAPGTEGVPDDETKIDVVPLPDDPDLSLQGRLDQLVGGAEGELTVLERGPFPLPSGLEAVYAELEGSRVGRTAVVVVALPEGHVLLQAYGDLTPLDAVARTVDVAP